MVTVQSILQRYLQQILNHSVSCRGSSRTDSGVHARDQRVFFYTHNSLPLKSLRYALNNVLPDDIRVWHVEEVQEITGPKKALAKSYLYLLFHGKRFHPALSEMVHALRKSMDHDRVQEALELLKGHHDVSAFKSANDVRPTSDMTMMDTGFFQQGDFFGLFFLGDRFYHHQIRNIVGSLLCLGLKKWTLEEFLHRWKAGDRTKMGATAPARGLHLWQTFMRSQPKLDFESASEYVSGLGQIQKAAQPPLLC